MRHNFVLLSLFVIFLLRFIHQESLGINVRSAPILETSILDYYRNLIYTRLQEFYPSPHVELLVGSTIGYDVLKNVLTFNDILRSSGTMHVVVVSGFNIVLLFSFIEKFLGSILKIRNYIAALIITLLYAVFAGFDYPVIRAWFMCLLSYSAKYLGLKVSSLHIIMFSGLLILSLNPMSIHDMSFQLSFLAVIGIFMINPLFENIYPKMLQTPFGTDFITSISAQLLVWPILSYKFGALSIISPFVNALVLWTIPRITILGMIAIPLLVVKPVSRVLSIFVYPFLDFFVEVVSLFGSLSISYLNIKISLPFLVGYYIFLFVFLVTCTRRKI